MKKKIISLLLTTVLAGSLLAGCGEAAATTGAAAPADGGEAAAEAPAPSGDQKEIAVFVPSADHGWTGAVLEYAQGKTDEMNADSSINGSYVTKVYAATDVENQIQQVDDLLANPDKVAGIVILPYDNGLQSELEKIAAAKIPFVQFDRAISSEAIDATVVANVKGDNEGIGYETAKRLLADGLDKDDYVYELIGDNSSVPELRSNGFRKGLQEAGWTDEEIDKVVVKSAATGWSRDTGKELFESWFDSAQCDPAKTNWIFTHDDEIAIGVLEALNGNALDATKKDAFLKNFKCLAGSSGLAEMYAILKDKHQTIPRPEYDIFSVTYDPNMITQAMDVMVDYLNGNTSIEQDYIIPVSVVDASNVDQFKAFGSYDEKQ